MISDDEGEKWREGLNYGGKMIYIGSMLGTILVQSEVWGSSGGYELVTTGLGNPNLQLDF